MDFEDYMNRLYGPDKELQRKAAELGIGFADLDRIRFDADTVRLIPADLAKQYGTLALKRQDRNLWIAVVEPPNEKACEAVRVATGLHVIPVLAQAHQIWREIENQYSKG